MERDKWKSVLLKLCGKALGRPPIADSARSDSISELLEAACHYMLQCEYSLDTSKHELFEAYSLAAVLTANFLGKYVDESKGYLQLYLNTCRLIFHYIIDNIDEVTTLEMFTEIKLVTIIDALYEGKEILNKEELVSCLDQLDKISLLPLGKKQSPSIEEGSLYHVFSKLGQENASIFKLGASDAWPRTQPQSKNKSTRSQMRDSNINLLCKLNVGGKMLHHMHKIQSLTPLADNFKDYQNRNGNGTFDISRKESDDVSRQINLISLFLKLEVFSNIKEEELQLLVNLAINCLQCAMAMVVSYEGVGVFIDSDSQERKKAELSFQEARTSSTWKAVENSVEILNAALAIMKDCSTQTKNALNNFKMMSTSVILGGLSLILNTDKVRLEPCKMKIFENQLKWYDGFNICLASFITKVVSLVMTFFDELKQRDCDSLCNFDHMPIKEITLFSECSLEEYMAYLYTSNKLTTILWNIFVGLYDRAKSISEAISQVTNYRGASSSVEKTKTASLSSASSDENSEDEGSVLGLWLEKTLASAATSSGNKDNNQTKEDAEKIDESCNQSIEILTMLAGVVLDVNVKAYSVCVQFSCEKLLQDGLQPSFLRSLGNIVLESNTLKTGFKGMDSLHISLQQFLSVIVTGKVVDCAGLEILLETLGVSSNAKESLKLPVNDLTCFTLATIVLSEQGSSLAGNGDMDNARAIWLWNVALDALEKNIKSADFPEQDLNKEFCQVLLVFWHNFSEKQKMIHLTKCVKTLVGISDEQGNRSDLSIYRLLTIFDYMLYCSVKPSTEVVREVAQSILNLNPLRDTSEDEKQKEKQQSVAQCKFLEEMERLRTGKCKHTFLTPLFYDLRENTSDGTIPAEVITTLQNLGDHGISYNDFYEGILKLMASLLDDFNLEFKDKVHMVVTLLSAEKSFQLLWAILDCLPPPPEVLLSLTQPHEICKDVPGLLKFLKFGARFLDKSKNPLSITMNTMDILEGIQTTLKEKKMIAEKLGDCHDLSYFLQLCDLLIQGIIQVEEDKITSLVVKDACLIFLINCIKELRLIESQGVQCAGFDVSALLRKLSTALCKCSQLAKHIIFSWANSELQPPKEIDQQIYSLVIDAGTVPLAKKTNVWALAPALPPELRDAVDRWKDIKMKTFEVAEDEERNFMTGQMLLIDNIIHGQLTPDSYVGLKFESVGILKHIIRTLSSFVEFLCITSKNDIDKECKKHLINLLVGFSTSPVMESYHDMVNDMMELLVQPLQEERVQEILQHHILTICDGILLAECSNTSSDREDVLIECLKFMKCVLDKPTGCQYFIEFYSDRVDSITKLIETARLKQFSNTYFAEVLQICAKVLTCGEAETENSVLKAVVAFFLNGDIALKEWLIKALTLPKEEEEMVEVANLLKRIFDYILASDSTSVNGLLDCCLDACSEILDVLMLEGKEVFKCTSLPLFLEIIPSFAVRCGGNGHITLIRRCVKWTKIIGEWFSNAKKEKREMPLLTCVKETCFVILDYLHKLLSCLKSMADDSVFERLCSVSSDTDAMLASDSYGIDDIDDDESIGEESDDDSLYNMLCTFTVTQKEFMNQHWYHCHTCKMNDGVGCCTICAKICHKDHDVTYAKFGSFFCDCGAKEDGSCKALTKRSPSTTADKPNANIGPFCALTKSGTGKADRKCLSDTRSFLHSLHAEDRQATGSHGKQADEEQMMLSLGIKREEILKILEEQDVLRSLVYLVEQLIDFHSFYQRDVASSFGSSLKLKDALEELHTTEKTVQSSENLVVMSGPVGGVAENVRLTFSEEQGQTVRQLLSAHVLFHTSLALIRSQKDNSWNVVVCHEKGRVTTLQVSGLDRQEESQASKVALTQSSTAVVPFTVLSVSSNKANEGVVAVCGLKDCHVLTFNNSKTMENHLALSLYLETGNFVIRTIWLPGSQTEIAILTADFVKVFDLSVSLTTPQYHFILPSGKVRDVTFIHMDGALSILVMSSHGHIYAESLNTSTSAAAGPFYLTNAMICSNPAITDNGGQIGDGGVSVYFSHTLQILLFSYSNGKNFVGVPNKELTELTKIFQISNALSNASAMCLWEEVEGHPGLIHCRLQSSGNPILLMLTTDKILVQEVKNNNGRTKFQDAVCFRYPMRVTSGDTWQGPPDGETVMIYLLEDGTFKMSTTENESSKFWLNMQSCYLRTKVQDNVQRATKATGKEQSHIPQWSGGGFPIDFFEHCQQSNDIEFGGKDLLHVYNSQQIKQRLNTAGMYIANTKPSGFKVEVINSNSANLMVGIRIHVGIRSLESAPKYLEIFGRTVQLHMDRNRWFDVPFTRTEALSADQKITITFGPSSDPSGVSVIDSIKVYTKTKEAFGWNDEQSEQSQAKSETSTNAVVVNVKEKRKFKSTRSVDSLLGKAVETVCVAFKQFPVAFESNEYDCILQMASYLLTIQFSTLLKQKAGQLLSSVFKSKEEFCNKQDELQLKHAVKVLQTSWECETADADSLDVDAVWYFLNVCKGVGRVRPANMVYFVEEFWKDGFVLQNILHSLLVFHTSQPVSSLLAPVYVQGSENVLNMIETTTEVLFTWILGKPDASTQITEILIKLLLNEDASVCFATKRGLAQGLQCHNKYVVLPKPRSPTTVVDTLQDARDRASADGLDTTEERLLSDVARSDSEILQDVEEVEVIDITEEMIANGDGMQEPEEIQAILQNTDDDAVLEMAIALSLQDAESPADDESRERWLPSPQMFPGEPSFQPLLQIDVGTANQSKGTDTDKENTDEESTIVLSDREKEDDTIRDSLLDAVISTMLSEFTIHIPDLRNLSGMRAIPYLQILLMLCSSLKENEDNKQRLQKVVTECTRQLQSKDKETSKFPERSKSNEVLLILMRFLSVLMSRHSSHASRQAEKGTKQQKETDQMGSLSPFGVHVGSLLVDQETIGLCFRLLTTLLKYWKSHKTEEQDVNVSAEGGSTLLKISPRHILLDTSPFFLKHYVKSHASDLFQDFPQLVTEMLLRLPYQIWKFFSDSKKQNFEEKWVNLLCEYLMVAQAPLIRRQVRKLLLALCGSKEQYRYVKDFYTLSSNIEAVRTMFQDTGPVARVIISYEKAVALTDHLKMCLDIATNRTENWQSFCQQDNGVLRFLTEISYKFSEEIAAIAIQLLSHAFAKRKETSSDGSKAKKVQTKDTPSKLILKLFEQCYSDCLSNFTKFLLVEADSKALRWKARDLLLTIYRNVPLQKQLELVTLMWKLYEDMPELGQRAEQFVDLMGYFTVKTNGIESEANRFAVTVVSHLKRALNNLVNHPNAVLYEQLQEVVDLDGYYVESSPCFTCNFPEVMFTNMKLSAVKSDLRYLTTAQLVKLNTTYNISKVMLRISDVKRTRMVKTMSIYYNNRAVQSVIELKNKRDMWQLAQKVSLTPAQTDVKVEFALPIVACNVMVEYSDFYDNLQLSAETLQCPRCSASVLANPGVCSNCGENVYQCHKCRAINYDERDPFLCTSCGFCKYGKFEYTLVARPCCSVEPIADEEDRQKALDSINSLLEQADKIYNQLATHKETIIDLLDKMDADSSEILQAATLSKVGQATSTSSSGNNVRKTIQTIATKYCSDCKIAFDEFSKLLQKITALRWELACYDTNVEHNRTEEIPSNPYLSKLPMMQKQLLSEKSLVKSETAYRGNVAPYSHCYGCTLSTIEHCLTVLKAMALTPSTCKVMLNEDVMRLGLQCSAQRKDRVRVLTYKLLMILMKDSELATLTFTKLLEESIDETLQDQFDDYRMSKKLQNKFSVLQSSLSMYDSFWEERLRCVFRLFLKVVHFPSPRMFSVISLPCLKIILDVVKCGGVNDAQKSLVTSENRGKLQAMKWIEGSSHHTFEAWQKSEISPAVQSDEYLAEKYGHLWLEKMEDRKRDKSVSPEIDSWLSALLFTPYSKDLRQAVCSVIENICQSQAKLLQVIQILTRYLDLIRDVEDHATEFLNLYKALIEKSEWKGHLATLGILEKIADLLAEHIKHLDEREDSVSLFGLSQGFAVHSFAELLKIFFADDKVRQEYKHKLISQILQNYLTLRRLVLQRTKLVDGAQEILLGLIEQLTSGREEEEESFITVCVNVLKECSMKDIRTPVFLFERVCSIIHKEEKEDKDFLIIIEKDSQQEEYLQGRMQGNPYNSKESGLGPLMRDIKNKICTECELVALLEDDTGMELLVNNKIISLDLPVLDVYKKIWCLKGERQEPMKIIYRMRGLLGDATEDIVENLDNDREKDVDEEFDYRRASVMKTNGGIDLILSRISNISNLSREQKLLSIILKLLEYCVKVKVNRCYLSQPSVRALEIMLGTVNMALRQERDQGSNAGGAATAERLLKVMEKILSEASTIEDQPTQDFTPLPVLPDDESQLDVLLGHITSPYVRSNPGLLQAVMKLIPFFSFGSEQSMYSLIDHFLPYLDFERLDTEHSVDEKLYLDCFCVIAGGISRSAHGSKLKGLINSRGITSQAIEYLRKNIPSKSYRASGILDAAKWKEFLAFPALPYVLRLLTGLATGHSETQVLIGTNENVLGFHMLEQVSSDGMVGSLAENLLEALSEHPDVRCRIKLVRKETREEKKRLAMSMRQKQLEALGLTVNASGQIKAKVSPLIKEITEVSDEKGLVCCICREGYEFHPSKILGIYTYTSRCILDEYENKPKKTQGYNTVSHFNVVHLDCHSEAVRHACSRDEWESATLQNGNAKCNGILPIWGPKVPESVFATSLTRYNSHVQDSTGFREPTLYSIIHDIRLLLALFAQEKSFSDRVGGGGKNSNMFLIPYMAHLALYVLNTTHQRLSEEKVLYAFLDTKEDKWVESAYELEGPMFMAVFSWFILPLSVWETKQLVFLKRLMLLGHVRKLSSDYINRLPDAVVKDFQVYKPACIFFLLVDRFHRMFKKNVKAEVEDWAVDLSTKMRTNDEGLLKSCEELLKMYEQEILPCESFEEFIDVAGLHSSIPEPGSFITELLGSLSSGIPT